MHPVTMRGTDHGHHRKAYRPHRDHVAGQVAHRRVWRRRLDGETCDDPKTAKVFRALVEAAGEHRPAGYPRGCSGRSWSATCGHLL